MCTSCAATIACMCRSRKLTSVCMQMARCRAAQLSELTGFLRLWELFGFMCAGVFAGAKPGREPCNHSTHMSPIISYFGKPIHIILHVFLGLPRHPQALPKSPRMPLWWRKIQGTQAGSRFPTICANGSVGHSGFWDGPAFRTRVICRDLQKPLFL